VALLSQLNRTKLPRHVAVIMDGNGRWAKRRHLPRIEGHRAGITAVRETVEGCVELGIEVLTLYAFSIENWKRPPSEVNALMRLLIEYLGKELRELEDNNVRFTTIGRIQDLPASVQEELKFTIEQTRKNTGLTLNLALNYGGQIEILDAVRHVVQDIQNKKLKIEDLNTSRFNDYLYTAGFPDLDLMIRTSGERRVSNFLLWQLAYAEIYITPVLWPDFKRQHLYEALLDFQKRERRFGRVEGDQAHV
jgi:undecaprenyl diphosphate synthase